MSQRIAVISDIHGNWPALEAVARDMENRFIDEVWCLGDFLGYGMFVAEVISWVKKNCRRVVLGNHEWAVIGREDSFSYDKDIINVFEKTKKLLTVEDLHYLQKLPLCEEVKENNCQLAHASFCYCQEFPYLSDPEDADIEVNSLTVPFLLVGHTHRQFVFSPKVGYRFSSWLIFQKQLLFFNKKYLICVGSVGQPRDYDCRAGYAIIEFFNQDAEVEFVRVEYDIKKAAESLAKLATPPYFINRLLVGE